ncbi:uncharacterized protein TRAVEDRAFT_51684 [Trametes versicolor FP-101664 SS1]|uniref:uncharacterized protein n=1 Tax=Trametes versicolor (strain FP-101664) TaxID=717944 RepID=UPI0004621C02|nr:uncharacterized protein TRAVEDRAFT_51684 [Trametes versicolor FP-101664 SS1]EIW53946.1 hypothetical protein TRAVEDRAFT_51684 [Trametes versicolor FP-101664 SS1]
MSALPVLNLYHVYAQDKPGAQRAKHKAQHLAQNTPHMQSGFIRVGGGLLPTDVKSTDPGAEEKIVGSFIVVKAESIDVVWDTLKKDIFYTSGEVWDLDKVCVTPVFVPFKEAKLA